MNTYNSIPKSIKRWNLNPGNYVINMYTVDSKSAYRCTQINQFLVGNVGKYDL